MDDKIYSPTVIADTPFPDTTTPDSLSTTNANPSGQVSMPTTIRDNQFPNSRPAIGVESDFINTRTQKIIQTFTFSPQGALQIGDYTQGVSGDIRISPEGIVARNMLGDTTFFIDGDTGDAFFAGNIRLDGDLEIQNSDGLAILDSSGLISSSNFNANILSNAGQENISSTTYVDIANPQLVFTASKTRSTIVLFFGSLIMNAAGQGMSGIITLEDNVSLGNEARSSIPTSPSSVSCSFIAIKRDLSPGEHTLKFRVKGDSVGTVHVENYVRSIGYLILGA